MAAAVLLSCGVEHIRSEIKLTMNEFIGLLSLNAIRDEGIAREVFEIERHDGISRDQDGGSELSMDSA